jgi:hypothetical protein
LLKFNIQHLELPGHLFASSLLSVDGALQVCHWSLQLLHDFLEPYNKHRVMVQLEDWEKSTWVVLINKALPFFLRCNTLFFSTTSSFWAVTFWVLLWYSVQVPSNFIWRREACSLEHHQLH